jgi:hypothetical protein
MQFDRTGKIVQELLHANLQNAITKLIAFCIYGRTPTWDVPGLQ